MRICITCIYWTLLFISVASSALLFIIVASENTQINYYSSFRKNETSKAYGNDTLNMGADLDTIPISISEIQDLHDVKANYKDRYYQEELKTVINGETGRKRNSHQDLNIITERLTQQPNLSQGVSESEQTTLLTLVDTTVEELQSLAGPKLNPEFSRPRLYLKNSSLLANNTHVEQEAKEEEESSFSTQTASLPIINEITENSNETNSFTDESLLVDSFRADAPEVVLVVRAEQIAITTDGSKLELEDSTATRSTILDEVAKVDETYTTSPKLSDIEAKARLTGDNRDEAGAAVLGEGIVPVGSSNPQEDIPSFSEWTQKRLEEAEKKKTHPNASIQNSGAPTRGMGGMKVRSKNYASPDCGAKIVAVNPEARSARSVLVSTRDEYMLNTCTSRIWFVVELCEAIQAKKIELANFELFSSSPKDFSVYISDRFPTREWSLVGQFTAKDEKDIQSFTLQPQLFGKFLKVELQTYYGSEHYCPISLFSAYGTSEFEVLETETENQIMRDTHTHVDDEEDSDEEEEEEEEVLDIHNGKPTGNLFGSARDAVLNIMKKAAEVLVKSSDLTHNNITNIQENIDNGNILENSFLSCTTPRYTILCNNCSDEKFAKIFQLVSCRERQLNQFLKIDIVNKTLRETEICKIHGVEVEAFTKRGIRERDENLKNVEKYDRYDVRFHSTKNFQFVISLLNSEYIAALCNVLAIKERKVVMNTSHEIALNRETVKDDASHEHKEDYSSNTIVSFHHTSVTRTISSNVDTLSQELKKSTSEISAEDVKKFTSTPTEISSTDENVATQIKSLKTTGKEEITNDTLISVLDSSKGNMEETTGAEMLTTVPVFLNIGQQTTLKVSEEPCIASSGENLPPGIISATATTTDNRELPTDDVVLDTEALELNNVPNKAEKADTLEREVKQGQIEVADQEINLSSQDSLMFDNLLSDLKDLEAETGHIPNGPAISASVTQSTTNTTPQKESVFLRLSNRIKVLERNMSLSGQYLEELSRRYKKQVEEMQRSLERTLATMSEETRKRDERELKRVEEIATLKEEIVNLSKSIYNLQYDRDSWRGMVFTIGQQILLICLQTLVIYLILFYCWRKSNKSSHIKEKQQVKKDVMRCESAENFNSHMKKTKKRRPSEIASEITDTCNRPHENKKGKKRRKKATILIDNQANVNDDTETYSLAQDKTVSIVGYKVEEIAPKISSVEVLSNTDSQNYICKRFKSAPESKADGLDENVHKLEHGTFLLNVDSSKVAKVASKDLKLNNSYIANTLSSDTFPRNTCNQQTTESSTNFLNFKNISDVLEDRRLSITSSYLNDVNGEWSQNSGTSDENTRHVSPTCLKLPPELSPTDSDTTTNGTVMDQSDESRNSSVISMSKKKEKGSFRKMIRKLSLLK